MKESWTRAQLRKQPVTPYASLRDSLETGDLIFCSGDLLASKLIGWGTKSAFSHIGMIVRLKEIDRVFLLESVETGVRFAPLSLYVGGPKQKGYYGALALAKTHNLSPEQRVDLARHGSSLLAQRYGFWNVFLFTCYVWFGLVFKPVKGQYMCSDLVATCLQKVGFKNFKYEPAKYISPGNLWKSPDVEFLARLR